MFLGLPIGYLAGEMWTGGYKGGSIVLIIMYLAVFIITCIIAYKRDP